MSSPSCQTVSYPRKENENENYFMSLPDCYCTHSMRKSVKCLEFNHCSILFAAFFRGTMFRRFVPSWLSSGGGSSSASAAGIVTTGKSSSSSSSGIPLRGRRKKSDDVSAGPTSGIVVDKEDSSGGGATAELSHNASPSSIEVDPVPEVDKIVLR